MKKISIITLFVIAVITPVFSQVNAKYVIDGSAAEEGKKVYLMDQISSKAIDSTVVSGGVFKMKGDSPKDAFLKVIVDGNDWSFPIINDGEPITLKFADRTMTGSKLNNRLSECDRKFSDAYTQLSDFVDEFSKLSEEESKAKMPEYLSNIKKFSYTLNSIIDENKDNLVPIAFINYVPSLNGMDRFNELLSSGAPFASHPYVLDLKRKIDDSATKQKEAEKRKSAIIGQKFLDLEEADPEGVNHKLSEYVGKGKWVLVDFWASWCGPCKKEMPNVVAAYKKYHEKGFDIVGVSFDRNKELWVNAIETWEMPWIHLSDLKLWQNAASEIYSVNSIPDNLLINPEGIVVARGLRGEQLEAKLAEVIK